VRVVVDSCVYIDWLKRRDPFVPLLMPYLKREALLVCGLIRCEVLRGIRDPALQSRMNEFFSLAVDIPTDGTCWDGVWPLGWKLDRQGMVLPMTDLCIAHIAMTQSATLITTDQHFAKIPGLKTRSNLPA
jgi:predicted nucleic acid-binding protein